MKSSPSPSKARPRSAAAAAAPVGGQAAKPSSVRAAQGAAGRQPAASQAPGKAPGKALGNAPGKAAGKALGKAPAKAPAKIPAKTPGGAAASPRPVRRPAPAGSAAATRAAGAVEDIRDAVWRLKSERIVAAAVDLFYRQGYTRTTLEQVADALNVTKPFIYAHFKSKDDLLAEICSRAIRVSHQALDRAVALQGSPGLKLQSLARDFMFTVLTHQAHAVIYYREEKNLAPEGSDEIRSLRRAFDRRLVSLLEEGVASGEFTVDDVPLTALAIGGIVGWAPVWYREGGRLSAEEASDKVGLMVLAMVHAKGTKAATRRRAAAAR